MKLAILSDLHLGYERFYDDAYRQAKEALDEAARFSDAILIPGDIFDKHAPKPEVMAQAVNLFRELGKCKFDAKVIDFKSSRGSERHTDVPIIAVPGTHERTAEGKENPLTVLSLAGLLIDISESTITIQAGEERVSVFGLGGLSEEMVKGKLEELKPKPVPGSFNVFMFHQSTYELLPFSDRFIHNDDLPKGFDLYIDGHIHSKVTGKVHGSDFLIPGSTVLTQLKDTEQERKGLFIYDTKSRSFEFKAIKSRPFISIALKFDGATPKEVLSRTEAEVESRIRGMPEKPIVRVRLEGTMAKGYNGVDMPIRALHGKFSSASTMEIDMRLIDAETKDGIEEVREGKVGGLSIKEMGMSIFSSKLKEAKFEGKVRPSELFEILSTNKKEKALKAANELLEKESAA